MSYTTAQCNTAKKPLEILLVEDNPGDVLFTQEALAEGDIDSHVNVAQNGLEALAFLRREGDFAHAPRPDLILLDLNMPHKDGRETLIEIKQDEELSAIPLVIVTVSESEHFLIEQYNLAPNSYFTKPTDLTLYTQLLLSLDVLANQKRPLAGREERKQARQEKNEARGEQASTERELSILLLEDNPGDALLVEEYLSEARGVTFTLVHATRLNHLRERLTERRFDVILLDLSVPDSRGLDTLTCVQEYAPETPIVVITGDANVAQGVQAVQVGAQDYLLKGSINEQMLSHAVDNAIAKHHLQRQVKTQYDELEARRAELERRNANLEAANQALHASEKRYEGMVANVPGLIYRFLRHRATSTSEFLYVSEGCRALFGIAPEQILTDPLAIRRMVHPEEEEEYRRVAAFANAHVQPWRWQGRFVLPSGEVKIIQGRGHPDLQANGDVLWDGLMMDVTERVQAEQQAAQMAAIAANSVDAIKSFALDGIVTRWNKTAEEMYGYSAEEMIGQPIARLFPPDRLHEVDGLLKHIARGESVQSYETVCKAKDGTLLDVALMISPVRNSSGNVIGAASIAQNIRQRKESEAHIRQAMQRIQALRTIDIAITASLDIRVTLNVLLNQVTSGLNVDSAAVLLLNLPTFQLEYAVERGFHTRRLRNINVRMGEDHAGCAALDQRILNIPDLREDGRNCLRSRLLAEEGFVSYWAIPLITKGRVVGVLELFHRSPLHGDSDWRQFLEALAGQAAIAIENAALFTDLQRSNVDLQIAYDTTLEGWSKALDLRDKETEGHTLRVTEATMTLASAMHIAESDLLQMRRGAMLHDIGKMGIPDSILLKPGALSPEEWTVMKKHPDYAHDLLAPIPFLRPALDIPYCHHEKWDGSGYPRGLKGEQIPLSARLFAVVDVWDALRSDRPYRKAWSAVQVRDHIAAGSGSHFDPHVVEVFLATEM